MTKLQFSPVHEFKYDLSLEKDFKRSNIFEKRPEGIIIMDTFNNPYYPIKKIQLDSSKFNYTEIRQELNHMKWVGDFFPWHYQIELIDTNYVVMQTRPFWYKNPIKKFEDYIIICIVGDTNTDIYLKKLYKSIADIIINSCHYIPSWKLEIFKEITLINIGKSFDENLLLKYLK